MCLRLQVNWIRSYNEHGCWISLLGTLRHKPAQIRWIQCRVFTLYSTCIQYSSRAPLLHTSCCSLLSLCEDQCNRVYNATSTGRGWDQKATRIYKPLVHEFNSKAQRLFVLKLTHYLATTHNVHITQPLTTSQRWARAWGCSKWDVWRNFIGDIIKKESGFECVRGGLVICQWFRGMMKCLSLVMDRGAWISTVMWIWGMGYLMVLRLFSGNIEILI